MSIKSAITIPPIIMSPNGAITGAMKCIAHIMSDIAAMKNGCMIHTVAGALFPTGVLTLINANRNLINRKYLTI